MVPLAERGERLIINKQLGLSSSGRINLDRIVDLHDRSGCLAAGGLVAARDVELQRVGQITGIELDQASPTI